MSSHTTLTLESKLKVINELESSGSQNFAETARKYGISRSAVSRLWKNREQVKKDGQECRNPSRKRKRAVKEEDVESALKIWLEQKNEQHARINAPLLKEKARQLASQMGHEFEPTEGWLNRFKHRNGLSFKREHGEKQSTDFAAAESFQSDRLPQLLSEYSPDDIYNADETGLFFKGFPDRGYTYKGVELSGGKKQKDRVTVLVCTNMSGSDKRKLLVIGKSKQPRGFPSNLSKLPVVYRHSANAWMTSQIFTEYLQSWDRSLRLQGRSILLLVDNCSAHPAVEGLISIRIEFLPPNTTATLQPCDQGIIRNLKCHYRSALNRLIISELDADESKSATDIAQSITTLRAVYLMFDAWINVTQATIVNCYRKAGFISSAGTVTEDDATATLEDGSFTTPVNMTTELFNEFIDLDNEEPVTGELDDKAIIESVKERKECHTKQQATDQQDADDDEDDQPIITMPSSIDLMQSLNNVRCFMELSGLTSQTHFDTVTKAIQRHVSSSRVQSSITQFFQRK